MGDDGPGLATDGRHRRPRGEVPGWFGLAALAGGVHAAMSCYWAAGGRWLLWSLSGQVVQVFAHRMWLLWPVGLVKAAGALGPVLLARAGWPWQRTMRTACWLAAVVLVVWGGMNTVVGNAVLVGCIHPDGGYDRADMVGHARVWDPLFLVWGLALALGLLGSRRARGSRCSG